jgi:hypothetical protein
VENANNAREEGQLNNLSVRNVDQGYTLLCELLRGVEDLLEILTLNIGHHLHKSPILIISGGKYLAHSMNDMT